MLRLSHPTLLTAGLATAFVFSGCNKTPAPASQTTPAPGSQPTVASAPPGTPNAVAPPTGTPPPTQGTAPATGNTPASQVAGRGANTNGTTPNSANSATKAANISAATSPVTSAPAPALVVPANTRVTIRTNETLSAQRMEVGQSFTGSLNYPITVRGTTAFRRGTEVRGTITSAKGRGRFKGAGILGVTLDSIGGYRVTTTEYTAGEKGRGKRTAGFIGGGGGAGALIGGLAGGGKGALIGGLLGAGGGTAASALTGNRDVVIPAESSLSFTTESAIRLK